MDSARIPRALLLFGARLSDRTSGRPRVADACVEPIADSHVTAAFWPTCTDINNRNSFYFLAPAGTDRGEGAQIFSFGFEFRSQSLSELHFFHMRRQVSGDQCGRAAAHIVESPFKRRSDFPRLAHGFAVSVPCLRELGEIGRRIENSAVIVAGSHRHAVWIGSHQAV